ncbi:MAG: hypothetical protein AAF492_27690, partial [Verrucomicrobiota bacterium]
MSKYHAAQRRLFVTLPPSNTWFTLSLEQDTDHPWFHFYPGSPAEEQPAERAALIYEPTDDARVGVRIISHVLKAARPHWRMHFYDAADDAEAVWASAESIVLVGDVRLSPNKIHWLNRQLDRGARVICLPSRGPPEGKRRAEASLLPGWSDGAGSVAASTLRINPESAGLVSDALLDSMNDVVFRFVAEPSFAENGQPILQTREGGNLVLRSKDEAGREIWALGFPLLAYDNSPVFQPTFPLFSADILLKQNDDTKHTAEVGQRIRPGTWFGTDVSAGTLHLPDGETRSGRRPWLPITEAGAYRLELPETNLVRWVNYPRLDHQTTFERERWERIRPNTLTHWIGPEDQLDLGHVQSLDLVLSHEADEGMEKRFDL